MATPLALLGFFRNAAGTAEYGAGRGRTSGSWHLVRKQYGDNLSTYNYARFFSQADFNAAVNNLDAAPWVSEPYSEVDYTLILLGLNSAIPSSTSTSGALVAATGGSTDVSPVVNAIGAGNKLLTDMLAGQSTPGSRASETTLALVLAALKGSLTVMATGHMTVDNLPAKFWPDTQPISGTVAIGNWPTVQAVSLAAVPLATGAATSALQTTANGLLADVKSLLGGSLAVTLPATAATSANQLIGNTSLAAIDSKLAASATKAGQDIGNTALLAIQGNTAAGATAAKQDALAGKQDATNTALAASNGYLATIASQSGPQPASAYNLVSLAGNNAKSVRAGATWLLGGTVTNTASAFRYLMLYDLPGAPVSASVPNMILAIEPGRTIALPIPAGRYVGFPTGLALAGGTASTLGALTTVVAVVGTSTGLAAGELVINLSYAN